MTDTELTTLARRNAAHMRGSIVNEFAALEITIDIKMAEYFCYENRQRDFLKILFTSQNVIFEKKRTIFNEIIKNNYLHTEFYKKNPNYHARIGHIIDLRNVLSHAQLDITPDALHKFKTSGDLVLLDKTKDRVIYTTDKIQEFLTEIINLVNDIYALPNFGQPNSHRK